MTTFRQWLLAQKDRPDHIGHLATDFEADVAQGCARYIRTPESIRKHIAYVHGPIPEAMEALERAIAEWRGHGGQEGAGFGTSLNNLPPMGDSPKAAPSCPPSASSQVRGVLV